MMIITTSTVEEEIPQSGLKEDEPKAPAYFSAIQKKNPTENTTLFLKRGS